MSRTENRRSTGVTYLDQCKVPERDRLFERFGPSHFYLSLFKGNIRTQVDLDLMSIRSFRTFNGDHFGVEEIRGPTLDVVYLGLQRTQVGRHKEPIGRYLVKRRVRDRSPNPTSSEQLCLFCADQMSNRVLTSQDRVVVRRRGESLCNFHKLLV